MGFLNLSLLFVEIPLLGIYCNYSTIKLNGKQFVPMGVLKFLYLLFKIPLLGIYFK